MMNLRDHLSSAHIKLLPFRCPVFHCREPQFASLEAVFHHLKSAHPTYRFPHITASIDAVSFEKKTIQLDQLFELSIRQCRDDMGQSSKDLAEQFMAEQEDEEVDVAANFTIATSPTPDQEEDDSGDDIHIVEAVKQEPLSEFDQVEATEVFIASDLSPEPDGITTAITVVDEKPIPMKLSGKRKNSNDEWQSTAVPYPCNAEGCDYVGASQSAIWNHRYGYHNVRTCRFCQKKFFGAHQLKKHEQSQHSKSMRKILKCRHCGHASTHQDAHRSHEVYCAKTWNSDNGTDD